MNYLILILLLLTGCENQADPMPDPKEDPSALKVLWSEKLNPDSTTSFTGPIHINGDQLIFLNSYFKPHSLVQSRNIKTGKLNWTYDNPDLGELLGSKETVFSGNEVVINAHGHFYNINTISGASSLIDKQSGQGLGWPAELMLFDNYLYCSNDESGVDDNFSNLVRRKINGGEWENIFTEEKGSDGYSDGLNIPIITVQGLDTILLFANRMWHFANSKGRFDVMAYSLAGKKIKWKVDSIDPTGLGSSYPPIIYQGKVYFQGHHTLYCIDIESGEQLWKFAMPEYLHTMLQCQPLIADNKLFLKSNDVTLYALNPQTGILDWKNEDTEYETQKLQYANGMVMFTSHHYLLVINARTGQTIWKKKSPFEDAEANFNGWIPIGVNEKDSIIYACDKKNIMAIKMPELK
ncbi:MAG: PQQ-binding-like beta-propeller repeat protein [Saprospiraceae bacterium]